MAISSLVITLKTNTSHSSEAVTALQNHPQIEVGTLLGQHLPCVLDTPHVAEDHSLFEWIQALAGVHQVQVTYVHLDVDSKCSTGFADKLSGEFTEESSTEAHSTVSTQKGLHA